MDKSGASAYVYAKASGMLARSFVGNRVVKLFDAHSLSELWALLFSTEVPLVPENLLAKQIEITAQKQFIKDYTHLVSCYSKPEPIYLALLKFYEYTNLKDIVSALTSGKTIMPNIIDIGQYSTLKYDKWPKLEKITENSDFSWCTKPPVISEQKNFHIKMDRQYVAEIWQAVNKLPVAEKKPVKEFIQKSLSYKNICWAVRLLVYYNMKPQDVPNYLLGVNDIIDLDDPIAGEAVKILSYPIDNWETWHESIYSDCINPYESSSSWLIDPRWLQQAMNKKINTMALKRFHQFPFTANVLVTWFKIKQFELDCIRTAAESLRLNVNVTDAKKFVGIV